MTDSRPTIDWPESSSIVTRQIQGAVVRQVIAADRAKRTLQAL
jgi:hypothetical protein